MLLNSVPSRRAGWTTALLLALSAASATAGSLDPPAAPDAAASAMFTLTDLYNRLNAGTAGGKRSGVFVGPPAGAIAGTGHTLDQIMELMPALDNVTGADLADVLAGKKFWSLRSGTGVWGGPRTGTMVNQGAFSLTCGTGNQTVNAGYYSGGTLVGNSFLAAENIKSGVILFGVTGTYAGTTCTGTAAAADVLISKTFSNGVDIGLSGIMPEITTDQASTAQGAGTGVITLTAPQGYYDGTDKVTATDAQVAALDADITAANIKKDKVIFGLTGTAVVATGDAATGDVLASKTFSNSTNAGLTGTRPLAPVPQTGQTVSYASGDDGNLQKGVAFLPSPRFLDNSKGTVTDNLTQLIWLKNAHCANTLRDWATALADVASLNSAGTMNSNNCGDISNAGSHQTDWRLPNQRELFSLIDPRYLNPALSNTAGTGQWAEGDPFTGVRLYYYWSSTTYSDPPTYAWGVYFKDGDTVAGVKTDIIFNVWPVRGGL